MKLALLLLPLLLLGEEPKKTSFAVLSGFTWSIGVTLPKEVQLLDDVTVDISGFMMREIPGSGPVNTFLLINDACGCNGTPKMNEIVFCALAEGVTMDVKPGIVHVIGKLFVGEQKEDGEVIALYSMDADSAQ
jgi:hypothetical protein